LRHHFDENLKPFWHQIPGQDRHPGQIAFWPRVTRHEASFDGINADLEDNRDRDRGLLRSTRWTNTAARKDHIDLAADELSGQWHQPFSMPSAQR